MIYYNMLGGQPYRRPETKIRMALLKASSAKGPVHLPKLKRSSNSTPCVQ